MLLDPRHVALNDIIILCKEAADHYLDAAERVDDAQLSALFRRLADQREQTATELSRHIIELGALPRVPDTDRETLERLVLRMKATLSADERLALIEEHTQAESEIADLTIGALRMNLPEATHAALHRLQEEVTDAMAHLKVTARQID